jgi:hypothetical protein
MYSDGLLAGWLGFDSRQGEDIFLCCVASRQAVGLTQPPKHWVEGYRSPGVKRRELEAHHSPPSRDEVENAETLPPLPIYLHGIVFN